MIDRLLEQLSLKNEKILLLTSSANIQNGSLYVTAPRKFKDFLVIQIVVKSSDEISQIISFANDADKKVRFIIVDVEQKTIDAKDLLSKVISLKPNAPVLTIKPNDYTVDALDQLLAQKALFAKTVALVGAGNIGLKIATKLVERGIHVKIHSRSNLSSKVLAVKQIVSKYSSGTIEGFNDPADACVGVDVVVGCSAGIPLINEACILAMKGNLVIDAGHGTVDPSVFSKKTVLSLGSDAGLFGALTTLFYTKELLDSKIGSQNTDDFQIISGGVIGQLGDIIVDNYLKPTKIVGVADGKGRVLFDTSKYSSRIEKIEKLFFS